MRMYWHATPDDEPAKDTRFYKILRWQVYNPAEALDYAAGHHRRAAEARSRIPDPIRSYRDQSQARWLESVACGHEEVAAVCERHAARLQAEAEADERATAGGR